MANVAEVTQEIADATGIAPATVVHVARKLGENGWWPRGARGRHAAQFDAENIGTLLAGVMAIAGDAVETPASRVQTVMQRIKELRAGGEAMVNIYEDAAGGLEIVPSGSFIANVAGLIEGADLLEIKGVQAVGLTFGAGAVTGWAERQERPGLNHTVRRDYFGPVREVMKSGMTREVRVSVAVLAQLAELIDQQEEQQPQDDLPLAPTGTAGKKKSTRTPEATAPIHDTGKPGSNPALPLTMQLEHTPSGAPEPERKTRPNHGQRLNHQEGDVHETGPQRPNRAA